MNTIRSSLFVGVFALAILALGNGAADNTINIHHGLLSFDGDDTIDDLLWEASIGNETLSGVNITVELGGVPVAYLLTDDEGQTALSNLSTEGEYWWNASYDNAVLDHEGGMTLYDADLGVGVFGIIDEMDGNEHINDFFAMVCEECDVEGENGTGLAGNGSGYVRLYNATGVEDEGYADETRYDMENLFLGPDLARGNYTFDIWLGHPDDGGILMQSSGSHSYGPEKSDSDEWFHDDWLVLSDVDEDGQNDTATVNFVADTDYTFDEMDVEVMMEVVDSNGDWVAYDFVEFSISAGNDDSRSLEWTAGEDGSYTFNLVLEDENGTQEDYLRFEDVWLYGGDSGRAGGYDPQHGDSDEWFTNVHWDLADEDDDGFNDTLYVSYEEDTDNSSATEVMVILQIEDVNDDNNSESEMDWWHEIYPGVEDWRGLSFSPSNSSGNSSAYNFSLIMIEDGQELEHYVNFANEVELTARANENYSYWFTDFFVDQWDDDGDGRNDTAEVGFSLSSDGEGEVQVFFIISNSSGEEIYMDIRSYYVDEGGQEEDDFYLDGDDLDGNLPYEFALVLFDKVNDEIEDYREETDVSLYPRNRAPVIEYVDVDTAGDEGEELTFTVIASDPDGDSLWYYWGASGGGGADGYDISTFNHSFYDNGNETIWLEIDDRHDGRLFYEFNVTIHNVAPVIHEVESPDEMMEEDRDYCFWGNISDAGEWDWHTFDWRLTDGNRTLADEVDIGDQFCYYFYDDGDDLTLTFTVHDDDGGSDSIELHFAVANVAPELHFRMMSDSGVEGLPLQFMLDVWPVGNDTLFLEWDFGDGNTEQGGDFVEHTWEDDGEYAMTVTASDEDGGTTSESFTVMIENAPPTFGLIEMPSDARVGDLLHFSAHGSDLGADEITTTWDFDDGSTAEGTDVEHTYLSAGYFVIKVCLTDDDGAETCDLHEIAIEAKDDPIDEGGLPGFTAIAGLGALALAGLRRRR